MSEPNSNSPSNSLEDLLNRLRATAVRSGELALLEDFAAAGLIITLPRDHETLNQFVRCVSDSFLISKHTIHKLPTLKLELRK
jgi:hypothetical protein